MKVKAIWMLNNYKWEKHEREVANKKEADIISIEISKKLNAALNSGKIKDYRVEF